MGCAVALACRVVGVTAVVTVEPRGTFMATGSMVAARSQHSATLLVDGRVLLAGGMSNNAAIASTEIYDPAAGTFRAATPMTAARRMHTATLLPDDRVLIVGGYGDRDALASAEIYDPLTGTFTAAGSLNTPRGGHSAIALPSGKVLIIGGYATNAYPDVAPAEIFDPVSGTFTSAGDYIGRGGCDFCAPSVLLPDGTALFSGQYPAQIYDSLTNRFGAAGMMMHDQSAATVLLTGRVLFAGGATIGRIAEAQLYDPATRTFVATTSMTAPRVWHTLTLLPDGLALATGGETDACSGAGCWFAGSLSTAELYDPTGGTFVPTGTMVAAREAHTATLLADGRVLVAGGASYGGIGIFGGSLASAELYWPDRPVAAAALVSVSRDGHGPGVIFHGGTNRLVTTDDPAAAAESVDIDCTGLPADSVIPPQVAVGGRMAAVLGVSRAPVAGGVSEIRVRVPGGIPPGPLVRVRLTYLDRPSNEVTIAVR